MRNAEKRCRKLRVGEHRFSLTYKNLSNTKLLWNLVIKKKKGQRISNTFIRQIALNLRIETPTSTSFLQAVQFFKEAQKKYGEFIPNAYPDWQLFMDDLASVNAILAHVSSDKTKKESLLKEKILKQTVANESSRHQHSQLRMVFKNKLKNLKQLDWIQELVDNEWVERNSPTEINRFFNQTNSQKYTSSYETPLLREPCRTRLGDLETTDTAKAIQKGRYKFPLNTDKYVVDMLNQRRREEHVKTHILTITNEEYK